MKKITTANIYKKTKKIIISKKNNVETNLKDYLQTEIAPHIYSSVFESDEQELHYYSRICNLSTYLMIHEFEKNNLHLSNIDKSNKILAVAKLIEDKDKKYFLTHLALELNHSYKTLAAVSWSSIHIGNYDKCRTIISLIEKEFPDKLQSLDTIKKSLNRRLKNKDLTLDNLLTNPNTTQEKDLPNKELVKIEKHKNQKDLKSVANEVYEKFADNQNIEELMSYVLVDLKKGLKFSEKEILITIINISKLFNAAGDRDTQIILIERLLKIKKNTMTVRSAFWVYSKAGRIKDSRNALDWLETFALKTDDNKILEFVTAKKKMYLLMDINDITKLIDNARAEPLPYQMPKNPKIAYVLHNTLPYASGGYATRGHGLASALNEKGLETVIVGRPGFPLDIREELTEKDVTLNDSVEGVEYQFILNPKRKGVPTIDYIEQASNALVDKFLELKPSLIVAASNHLTGLPSLIAARKLGIPFIYEARGFWEITRISREPEFEHTDFYQVLCDLEALVAEEAHHVFTLTTGMVHELERRGINKNKITIIPNSCNPDNFEPVTRNIKLAKSLHIPKSVPVIGYIGTFVQYEGLEHLAEACGLLKQKGVEFRLLIVGNENTAGNDKGPISEHILEVAKQFDFENWLIMPGRVPHEEVEAYYSLVDIAPFPRKPQPVTEMVSPMKPLEAAAMKKAIVVSNVRALTDMIEDGQNGLVFEKGNIEDFAEKLHLLINDDKLRHQLGENARKWVEEDRTWNMTATKFIDVLDLKSS